MITREEVDLVTEWVDQCGGDYADLDSCLVNAPDGMTLGRAFFVLHYLADYVRSNGHLDYVNNWAFGPMSLPPPKSCDFGDVFHQIELAKRSLESLPEWVLDGLRQDGTIYGSKK